MRCADIMKTDVLRCRHDDTARQAAQLMRQHNIGFLPVVDETRRLVGVVTDRDLTVRVLADDAPTSTRLADLMTKDLVTCHPEDHLRVAEEKMAVLQKSRMLVVGDAGELLGIISLSDIARAETKRRAGKLLGMVTRREVASPSA
ncbi:MAG: CBS domain-containing protein [Myxococcota bacterium]